MYEVIYSPRSIREFKKLSSNNQERIADATERLADNPRPVGVKKLTPALYRIRVGDWRVIYSISDNQQHIIIVKIARRSEETYTDLDELF
jgi:mRNA interferase RelE/StbE